MHDTYITRVATISLVMGFVVVFPDQAPGLMLALLLEALRLSLDEGN